MAKLFVIGNTIGEVHLLPHQPPGPGGCVLVPKMGFAVGGAAMNTAIQAARLGVSTGVAGVLGDDPIGRHIKSQLHEEKIDVNRLQLLANCSSPIRIVQTDLQGKRSYVYSPGTNEDYKLPEIVYRVPCKLFHLAAPELLTGAWPNKVVDIARNLKAARKTLTFDTFATGQGRDATLRHRKEHRHLLDLVEIAFFNEQTAALISGRTERKSVVNYFHKLGVQIVVIRRGAEGALVSWSGGMKAVAAAKTAGRRHHRRERRVHGRLPCWALTWARSGEVDRCWLYRRWTVRPRTRGSRWDGEPRRHAQGSRRLRHEREAEGPTEARSGAHDLTR